MMLPKLIGLHIRIVTVHDSWHDGEVVAQSEGHIVLKQDEEREYDRIVPLPRVREIFVRG